MSEKILAEYDENLPLYEAFTKKVGGLIEEILHENNIHVHSVTYRVKERASLNKKISQEGKNYSQLDNLTDISGIRITTYLEDDVERVAELIKNEFSIDEKNSVDKKALLDPDRFGYLSLHHVISLSPKRCELTEYKRFPALKAEIQTRSILQHAWAEIEHDLGYKSAGEIPRETRRRFSRLASLLELADQEFISIKNELNSYEKILPERIQNAPESVELDKQSLSTFILNSPKIEEIDREIAIRIGADIPTTLDNTIHYLTKLQFLSIKTIGELEKLLEKYSKQMISFAIEWMKHAPDPLDKPSLDRGSCLFYLSNVLVVKTRNEEIMNDYLETFVSPASFEFFKHNMLIVQEALNIT